MYESGQGVYPTTAQSFYNVNSVYSPMDNGRAAPQISAPAAHVPIYNPALGTDYLSAQAQQAAVRFMTNPQTNQPGYYDSRTMDASIYSAYKSELDARKTAKLLNYGSLAAGVGTAGASMVMGLSMLNPVTLGVTLGAKALDAGAEYYRGFENRIGDIRGIRQMYSGITSGAMIDPTTGRMTNASARNIVNALDSTAEGSGFTKQDVYQIHSMAGEMGLMQGHTGSASSIASRVKQLATLTKSIMDLGEGISPADALQMQQLSENMGVKLDKFKSLNISRQVVTAARLAGKTLDATNQTLSAAASATAGAGLGGQIGVESALFSSVTANSQFGFLSAEQQAAVGGSAEAFSNNLTQAHATFAARNAQSLAMGSYYLDPTTGQLKIDHGALQRMVELGLNPEEANKRGMSLIRGPEANRLLRDRSTRNLVQSVLSRDMGRLSREAASAIDPSTRLGMMGEEIVQRALSTNNLDLSAVATELYGEAGAAVLTQIQNYSQGRSRRREAFRNQQLQEMDQLALRDFTSADQLQATARAGYFESLGRLEADRAAGREDMLRREARDRFGATPGQYSTQDYLGLIGGTDYSGRSLLGARRRGGIYTRDISEGGFFAGTLYNALTSEDYRYGQMNDNLAAQRLRGVFANDFFGEGAEAFFENEGRGAIGEYLFNEGFSGDRYDYVEDLTRELYGEGSRDMGAIRLRRLAEIERMAEDGFNEHTLGRARRALLTLGDSEPIRELRRNLTVNTGQEAVSRAFDATLLEGVAAGVGSFVEQSRASFDNLNLSPQERAVVNQAERLASLHIGNTMASTSPLGPGRRTLGGQSRGIDIAVNARKTARHFIIEAYKKEGMTHEQAVERYNDLSKEDEDRLTEGVYAAARENESGNLNTFLGKTARKGMTGLALLNAGTDDMYGELMGRGLSGSRTERIEATSTVVGSVSIVTPARMVEREYNVSNLALLTGLSSDIEPTDFRKKLEDFGDLYTKLGDTLGQLSAQMRTWIVGRGSQYVGEHDLAVTQFISELEAEKRQKIESLPNSEKEQLYAHLKNIITATGATSGGAVTAEQKNYRDAEGFAEQINALGATGIESKRRGMAEEMLKDNPLAQLFGVSDSPAATTNFLRFMRRGNVTLIRSGKNKLLDVDTSIERTLGGSMQGLSGDVQERIREVFTNIFAGADPTKVEDMKKRSRQFRQAILNQMGSSPVPGQGSSGDTSVAAAATKINMLIQAAAGIIKALAIEDVNAARDSLEDVKNKLATLAAPSNAPAVPE
tara:strand:+ start:1025 stop:4816 length:3792 start_codon:yes stop_codon:yes gene_type:complete